ncbi:hypothetical protein [Pseudomonas abietaniphila]|jgi:hypothetical protein
MTVHLIESDDVIYLGFHMGYLQELPRRIESFKIRLGLVPAADYGKYREPALDAVVADARSGSTVWTSTAEQLRSLHRDTDRTLSDLIELIAATPSPDALKGVTDELGRHGERFDQMRTECVRVVECAARVIPRFIDFMNTRTFEYAKRKNLLTGATSPTLPDTLNRMLTDEENLGSAIATVEWNYRSFNTVLLCAGNMGAYCSRLYSLLGTTRQQLAAIDSREPARRQQVGYQSAASSALEAQRLIKYTTDNILRYSF